MRPVSGDRRGMRFAAGSIRVVGVALMLGVLWLLANTGQAYACSCVQPGSPSEELEQFDAVFAGRVVSIQHSFVPGVGVRGSGDRTTVGFEVSTVWKGDVHETMYVTTPSSEPSCGFSFVEGEEYIVYGYDSGRADDGYSVGLCSRTALLGQAQADLDALGEGDAPQAGTGGPAPEPPQATALGRAWALIQSIVAAVAGWVGWWCPYA